MKELSRKDRILKLIVDEFIKTAQPVGSSTLIDRYNLPYSSATIRNEMAELEDEGYLEKTHTSSGRVPSSKGYRYYVDNLREDDLDKQLKAKLQTLFEVKQSVHIEDAIKHSVEVISELTNLTSIVLGPDSEQEKLSKVQLIYIDDKTSVAVFVTDSGHVESKTFTVPEGVTFKDLETVINVISDRITGTPISQVEDKVRALKPLISDKVDNVETIFKAFLDAFLEFATERVEIYGRNNIFEQQEFANDIDKMKRFAKLLDKNDIWEDLAATSGIQVSIGDENKIEDLDDVSVVSAEIRVSPDSSGKVCLVGPKRMDYEKVISAVKFLQKQLEDYFGEGDE